jgi:ABC-2 type transport system permease protein
MRIHRVAAIFDRHMLETRRSLERITDLVYWPMIDVIMWGFFSAYLAHSGGLGRVRAEFLVVAAVFWSLFRGMQRDIAIGLLSEIWARNLTALLTTPLTFSEYVAGLTTVAAGKAVVSSIIALGLTNIFYVSTSLKILIMLVPFAINLVVFGFAVGILISGLIIRYSTRVQNIAWSVTGVLLPLSCVFYPMAELPDFLKGIAWLVPTSHSFEGIRQIMLGGVFPSGQLLSGLALSLFYAVLSLFVFGSLVRQARKLGLFVKPE